MVIHTDKNKSYFLPHTKSAPGGLKIECETQTTKTLRRKFREKYVYFIWLEKDFLNKSQNAQT